MRLSTCVALELTTGLILVTGLGVSVSYGVQEVRSQWHREAQAAETSRSLLDEQLPAVAVVDEKHVGNPPASASGIVVPTVETTANVETGLESGAVPSGPDMESGVVREQLEAMPRSQVALIEQPVHPGTEGTDYYGVFHGQKDQVLLAPLRDSSIKRVKFNRGGSSISLRIDFANGARAAFKPVQSAMQTVPRKEIAAYRINRLLGLNAVPPAIGRSFRAQDIYNALIPSSKVFLPRLKEEMRKKNGIVSGELSWWIPIIHKAKIQGYETDTTDGIVTWKRFLTVGKEMPEEEISLLGQISSMVLFDFIINNPDRWSGANARVSQDRKMLYFMDNTMSFYPDPDGHRKTRIYLKRSQKFSRSLVHALRTLKEEDIRSVVAHDKGPFSFLLGEKEIKSLLKRRDYALEYIGGLISEHGENAVLVFP